MTTKLLKKLEAQPAHSLAHGPLASLLALERARASDPAWVKRRAEAKSDDRRQTIKQVGLTALVGVVVVGLNLLAPGLVGAIANSVANHFALVLFTTVFAMLFGAVGFAEYPDLSSDWLRRGVDVCLLVGFIGLSSLLLAGSSLFVSAALR